MYSGISGLKNLQTKLDVIGNNVANVNTYGFKKSRVTFSDAMNQTVSGASAATANRGGTNSKQIGLGSTIATIDTIHTQSSLQTTGRDLDLGYPVMAILSSSKVILFHIHVQVTFIWMIMVRL